MRYFAVSLLLVLTGCGTPSLLITPVANTNKLEEIEVQSGKGLYPDKVAIIEVEGMLLNARTGGFLQPQENKVSLFTEELNRAASDSHVKAVVLRINSPGGTVTASDTMYQILKRFKAKTHKPVIASAQDVTASGAYYLACASDKIVVNPTSVVGSIGVIFETVEFEGTLNKIGVTPEAIKSGPLKDMGSPFRHMNDQDRAVFQGIVNEYYSRFLGVVKENRPVGDDANVRKIADGRVYSGEQAVSLGLADQTGLLEDAIDLARKMGDVPDAKAVMYRRPYGYRGSIYADSQTPQPQANVIQFNLADVNSLLPTGFYYLWQP
jgi:protease IV